MKSKDIRKNSKLSENSSNLVLSFPSRNLALAIEPKKHVSVDVKIFSILLDYYVLLKMFSLEL